jgi:hypothetical protein
MLWKTDSVLFLLKTKPQFPDLPPGSLVAALTELCSLYIIVAYRFFCMSGWPCFSNYICVINQHDANSIGHAVYGVGLRLLAYCDRGFEPHGGHGCFSVVCCQVEVSGTSWSLVQRISTDCGAPLSVIKKPRGRGGHSPRWAAEPEKIIIDQYDALFVLTLFKNHASKCYGPVCGPSSGSSECLCGKWFLFFF